MILDEIKKANVDAMRQKDMIARTILGVVMNKAMLETIRKREKGEELIDADMVGILQKTVKELTEEKENYEKVGNVAQAEVIEMQKTLVKKFLPELMSADEIFAVISSMPDKSIGSVMKKFKMEYAGKCDMRLVQDVLKKF